jgi:lipocalin
LFIGFNSTVTNDVKGLFGVAPAVTSVDLNAYIGYWYQMYADPIVMDTIEKDSLCDTALYGAPDADGHVSVLNTAKINKAGTDGTDYAIKGYA